MRLAYARLAAGAYRHAILCDIPRHCDDAAAMAVVRAMRRNPALEPLVERRHYRWAGASKILFRRKSDAASYMVLAPPLEVAHSA